MYEFYLDEFKNSGYHPHPANLLAMLILPEKNLFEPLKVCEGEFYKVYKECTLRFYLKIDYLYSPKTIILAAL